MMPLDCPLCTQGETSHYEVSHGRKYLRCKNCELIFMAPACRLPAAKERKRYELHNNSPDDPAYRVHLSKAVAPLLEVLEAGSCGLDFGCGPSPTAAVILEEAGFGMCNYDPFFAPEKNVLERRYDFIICTETAEHFYSPRAEFELIDRLLQPRGWLSLMTRVYYPEQPFTDWWYTKDPTHVSFYAHASLEWVACKMGWKIISSSDCVHLFSKEGTRQAAK